MDGKASIGAFVVVAMHSLADRQLHFTVVQILTSIWSSYLAAANSDLLDQFLFVRSSRIRVNLLS